MTADTSPKRPEPTALASWMRGLARELELRGLQPALLFEEVGLDPALLDQSEARYPVARTTKLWRRAVELTGDEGLGLSAIRHITPATFHAVGLGVMASETLEQAFTRMSRFADLVTDASQIVLREEGDTFIVELAVRADAEPADQSIDGFVALLANAGKGLGEPSLRPREVRLRRLASNRPFQEALERTCAAPVLFGQSRIELVFDSATVRTRLKGANPLIAEHLDQASLAAIERLKPVGQLSQKLRSWVTTQLAEGTPGLEDAAAHMHMSARNLQRKLAEEGSSMALLIDDVRQHEAMRRLKQTQDSMIAIALDLGFSDASAFSRACKRWFGKSPSDIRAGTSRGTGQAT